MGSFHAWKKGQRAGKGNIFQTRVPGGYVLDIQAVAAAWVRAVSTGKKKDSFSLPEAASAFFHH